MTNKTNINVSLVITTRPGTCTHTQPATSRSASKHRLLLAVLGSRWYHHRHHIDILVSTRTAAVMSPPFSWRTFRDLDSLKPISTSCRTTFSGDVGRPDGEVVPLPRSTQGESPLIVLSKLASNQGSQLA